MACATVDYKYKFMIGYAFYTFIFKSSLKYYSKPIHYNSRCLELSEKDGKTKCLKEIQY